MVEPLPFAAPGATRAAAHAADGPDGPRAHPIGHFLRRLRTLSDAQVGHIVAYQRSNDLRFGEAAIANFLFQLRRIPIRRCLCNRHSHPIWNIL